MRNEMEQEEKERMENAIAELEVKVDILTEEKQLQEDKINTLEYDVVECQEQIQQLQEEIADLKIVLFKRIQ